MNLYQPQAHLHDCLIIGLTGLAGAGKTTVADHLAEAHGFVQFAFADPLRDMACAMLANTPVDYNYFTEPALKQQAMPWLGVTGRRVMQTLGTEWGRALDPDLWVKLAALSLGLHDLPMSAPVHDRIVLSDVRFPNEAAWIRALGGQIWHVSRPAGCHELGASAGHISEAHQLPWDAQIVNSSTLQALHWGVDALAEHHLQARA